MKLTEYYPKDHLTLDATAKAFLPILTLQLLSYSKIIISNARFTKIQQIILLNLNFQKL